MLAVLCSGQGAQHEAMLELVAGDPDAMPVLDAAQRTLGADLRAWSADPECLFDNAIAQPLICVAQLATWTALRTRLPSPLAFAGYSVGELASYACAGALEAGELARLARQRASLMDEAAARKPGGLIALRGLSRAEIDALCRDAEVWPAIVLDATGFVLGGTVDALDGVKRLLRGRDVRVTCLRVGVPSHTPLLAAAVAPFRIALAQSGFRTVPSAIVSGIDGVVRSQREPAIEALSLQVARTIEWARCLDLLYERGCRVFLELGPGRALAQMLRDRFPQAVARAVDDFRSLRGAAEWVRRHTG